MSGNKSIAAFLLGPSESARVTLIHVKDFAAYVRDKNEQMDAYMVRCIILEQKT